jgi:protein TonB
MPRDLFGDVTRPSVSIGSRKWYTVPVSLLSHSAVVFAVIVIPLLAADVLPEPWETIDGVIIPLAPPPPPPPPIREITPTPPPAEEAIPFEAPTGFAPERDRPEVPWREPESPNIVMGTVESAEALVAPPRKPVEQPPIRVGGAIRQPQRIRDVAPVYPSIAQAARVQGIVIIEATIGADGQVVNTRVLRSVPLLDDAALDAVRQWHYTPTLLNGVPVPVIMTVTVQFTLAK